MNIYLKLFLVCAVLTSSGFGLLHAAIRAMAFGTTPSIVATVVLFIIVVVCLYLSEKTSAEMRAMHRRHRKFGAI